MGEIDFNSRLNNGLKKIKDRGVYTLVIAPEEYHLATEGILIHLTKKLNKKGIYVILSRSCESLPMKFTELGIDPKVLYCIDGTGRSSGKGWQNKEGSTKNATRIGNLHSLTELSLAITERSNTGEFQFLFFDSVTMLLLYNNAATIEKFIKYIADKMRYLNMGFLLIAINEEIISDIIPVL